MKKYIIIICLLVNSCIWHEHANRNKILFNSPLSEVESTILRLNIYFDKIREINNDTLWVNYYWNDSINFTLCDVYIGNLITENLDTVFFLQNFSKEEKKDFVKSILFLKDNYLSSMYLQKGWNVYLYDYRFVSDDWSDIRDIFYYNNTDDTSSIMELHKLLDQKGNLLLVKGVNYQM